MATSTPNGQVTGGEDLDTMKLPEHVEGFIDLQILVDIHKCLSESKSDDDRTLAAWVKFNYLQEPLNLLEEVARPIRDSEGFVNLDKAYRRARQLTGKAQDKWPFFNRNLKKLSSTLVKSAILGDAAMVVVRSEGREVWDTPTSNGVDGHRDNDLQNSKLQASLSANNLGKPADRHLDQQGTGHKTLRRDPSPVLKSSSLTDPNDVDGTANGNSSSAEELRDAGAGKARGPNGRYVIKDNPTPPTKNRSNIKPVEKARTMAAQEGESEGLDETSDEEVEQHKIYSRKQFILAPTSSALTMLAAVQTSSESGEDVPHDGNELPTDAQRTAAAPASFPVSAILAAEAEAVPSNLDRLPPGFAHKKRKSESSIPRGGPKRARGSRGGVLGRPRKSETLADRAKSEPEERMELVQPISQPETPASISTRRSSRKSAALESETPWDPTDDVLFGGASQKQPARDSTISPANGTKKALGSAKASKTSEHYQEPVTTNTDPKNGNPGATTAKLSAAHAKAQKAFTSNKQKKRVSFSPETQFEFGNVEFFARITTSASTQEVALLREDLTHEVDLVERYAEWKLAGNASVSFEVFKNIVKFARPG